ncbi:MAG: aldose 1-epimerase family protein [Lachnospiraceae bacterium]|nr:aldose 1-epimerase family protein [Lachnospiraceae bacterium]
MALFQIGNEKITIQIDSMGAELKSLKRVDTGTEYMWEGNPAFWKRTSPVLFPLVGGLKNGEYLHDGRRYPMGQHGFARDRQFQLKSQTNREIWFTLGSDEESLQEYPYEFLLELGYELQENMVIAKWKVTNPASGELHFSIGGHPAFRCPILEDTKQTDYRIRFDTKEKVISGIIQNGLMSDEKEVYPLENGYLRITEHLFDRDALVIEEDQSKEVALVKPDGRVYLTVRFDAPLFGIWSPPGKNAPFICIEPWYGRCDGINFTGTWEERKWGQRLASGESFEASYQIIV